MLGLWAVLTLTGVLYSVWQGYGGRAFAATLTAFAFFLLVMLLFAARGVEDRLASRFGAASGYLLGTVVFLFYLIYALGTNTFAFTRAVAVAAMVLLPLALAASAAGKPPGAWQDFATIRIPGDGPYHTGSGRTRAAVFLTFSLSSSASTSRSPVSCFYAAPMASATPSGGAIIGPFSWWQVSSFSLASPSPLAGQYTSFNSIRNGRS